MKCTLQDRQVVQRQWIYYLAGQTLLESLLKHSHCALKTILHTLTSQEAGTKYTIAKEYLLATGIMTRETWMCSSRLDMD